VILGLGLESSVPASFLDKSLEAGDEASRPAFSQTDIAQQQEHLLAILARPVRIRSDRRCASQIQEHLPGLSGARWNLNEAEAILRVSVLRSNGDFAKYHHFGGLSESGSPLSLGSTNQLTRANPVPKPRDLHDNPHVKRNFFIQHSLWDGTAGSWFARASLKCCSPIALFLPHLLDLPLPTPAPHVFYTSLAVHSLTGIFGQRRPITAHLTLVRIVFRWQTLDISTSPHNR